MVLPSHLKQTEEGEGEEVVEEAEKEEVVVVVVAQVEDTVAAVGGVVVVVPGPECQLVARDHRGEGFGGALVRSAGCDEEADEHLPGSKQQKTEMQDDDETI